MLKPPLPHGFPGERKGERERRRQRGGKGEGERGRRGEGRGREGEGERERCSLVSVQKSEPWWFTDSFL
jgi:hypothetical protein